MGEVLKIARIRRGVKQKQLASEVGISPQYLSQIETGKKQPSIKILFKIAKFLEMPIQTLINEFVKEVKI